MAVATYNPDFAVTLIKMIGRRSGVSYRYASQPGEIDITGLLGTAGTISLVKSITEPAGAFTLSFADRMDPTLADTVYALIEPMDMVIIRGSRQPHLYVGQPLPLLMRGFVTQVRRNEGMENDAPNRTVVVTGQDVGKLWVIHQIWFQVAYLTDAPYLDEYLLQAITGVDRKRLAVNDFLRDLTEKIMNKKIQQLAASSGRYLPAFVFEGSVPEGIVMPDRAKAQQGPVWNIAMNFVDRPWNEFFIEDRDTPGQLIPTPYVVFRPSPYVDINGKIIMSGAQKPSPVIRLDIEEVVTMDVGRSDESVANFYWVNPGVGVLDSQQWLNVSALQKSLPLDFGYGNNKPELYGLKKMELFTNLAPDEAWEMPKVLQGQQRQNALGAYQSWWLHRAEQLKQMNRDNVVFESGVLTCTGWEDYRPGRYIRVDRGLLSYEGYVLRVAHSIQPLVTWTTQLVLERGTGFLMRNKIEGSPYLLEGRRGPYGGTA